MGARCGDRKKILVDNPASCTRLDKSGQTVRPENQIAFTDQGLTSQRTTL
jgi:hypothetical protein